MQEQRFKTTHKHTQRESKLDGAICWCQLQWLIQVFREQGGESRSMHACLLGSKAHGLKWSLLPFKKALYGLHIYPPSPCYHFHLTSALGSSVEEESTEYKYEKIRFLIKELITRNLSGHFNGCLHMHISTTVQMVMVEMHCSSDS